LQTGFLVSEERKSEKIQAIRFGEGFEKKTAVDFFGRRAYVIAFDLRARSLNEFAVFDPGGAGGHTGHAAEAGIDMTDKCLVNFRFAFLSHFHQVNAAPRGIGFFTPQDVGGAGGQAEAAVNAFVDEFERGRLMRVESAGFRSCVVVGHELFRCLR
jgi:hypothetical protein